MAVAVQQPRRAPREESTMSKLSSALGIANQVLGISRGFEQDDLRKLQKEGLLAEQKRKQETFDLAKSDRERAEKERTAFSEFVRGQEGFQNLPEDVNPKDVVNFVRSQRKAQGPKITPFQQQSLDLKRQAKLDKDAQQLSKKFEDLVEPIETLRNLDAEISKVVEGGLDAKVGDLKGDIPGAGATGFIPGFALTDEGSRVKKNTQGLVNALLKVRSGGAVTPQEASRLAKEIGDASTDRELFLGLQRAKRLFGSRVRNVLGGFDQEARDLFTARGGQTFDDLLAPKQNLQTPSLQQAGIEVDAKTQNLLDARARDKELAIRAQRKLEQRKAQKAQR